MPLQGIVFIAPQTPGDARGYVDGALPGRLTRGGMVRPSGPNLADQTFYCREAAEALKARAALGTTATMFVFRGLFGPSRRS